METLTQKCHSVEIFITYSLLQWMLLFLQLMVASDAIFVKMIPLPFHWFGPTMPIVPMHTLRPGQNGRYLAGHIYRRIFLAEKKKILWLKFHWCVFPGVAIGSRKLFCAEQTMSPFLNLCWPRSASHCGITAPQFKTSYSGYFPLWTEPGHKLSIYHDMGLIIPYFMSQVNLYQPHLYFVWVTQKTHEASNYWKILIRWVNLE